MVKRLQGHKEITVAGKLASLRIGDRVAVSSVLSGVIQANRRFKEDVEAEVQLGKKVEDIPEFLGL